MIRFIFSSFFLVVLVCSFGLLVVSAQPVFAGLGGGEAPGPLPGDSSLWPGGTVYVLISERFNTDEKDIIWLALNTWRDKTGGAVNFYEISPPLPERYVHILTPEEFNPRYPDDPPLLGCNSWGPKTEGPTYTILSTPNARDAPEDAPNCINVPSIIHEIGHAIGLGHEQIRPDRDFYIVFGDPYPSQGDDDKAPEPWPETIQPNPVGFFDYYSFMHTRDRYATPLAPDVHWPLPWAQLGGPSDGDIDTVKALYAFDLYFHTDIGGGDFSSFPLANDATGRQATQRSCQLACAADVRCKAYTYVGIGLLKLDDFPENNERPYCFLKDEASTLKSAEGIDIHSGVRKPNQECSFGVAFNVDLFGGQISDGVVDMPHNLLNGNNCKDLCAQDPRCSAFTFVPGDVNGTCYKKTHTPDFPEPQFTYQLQDGSMSGVIRKAGAPLNRAPASDAGGPYTVEWASVPDSDPPDAVGTLKLDGKGFDDTTEGPRLAYFWTTDCPRAVFDDSRSSQPYMWVYALSTPPICSTQCNVSLIVTDDQCFRSSRSTRTVTIQDTTAPTLIGVPADQTLECGAIVPTPAHVTARDSYDLSVVPTFSETRVDGSCAANYTLTRTWTADDDCGNSTSATQTITVQDTEGPLIKCNDDAFITPSQVPISFSATATDNCSDATVQITGFDCVGKKGNSKLESCDVVFSGNTITIRDSGGVGDKITWTVQATDGCGNITNRTCGTSVVNLREYREIYK